MDTAAVWAAMAWAVTAWAVEAAALVWVVDAVLLRDMLFTGAETSTASVFTEAFGALPSVAPYTATMMVAGNGIAAVTGM